MHPPLQCSLAITEPSALVADYTTITLSMRFTFKKLLWVVIHFDDRVFLANNGLECSLQSLSSIFGVHIELGEVSGLCCSPVSVSEGSQTLQSLGHNAGKPLFPGQSRDEEDVLW